MAPCTIAAQRPNHILRNGAAARHGARRPNMAQHHAARLGVARHEAKRHYAILRDPTRRDMNTTALLTQVSALKGGCLFEALICPFTFLIN